MHQSWGGVISRNDSCPPGKKNVLIASSLLHAPETLKALLCRLARSPSQPSFSSAPSASPLSSLGSEFLDITLPEPRGRACLRRARLRMLIGSHLAVGAESRGNRRRGGARNKV